VNLLPGYQRVPCHPFTGFVINFNGITLMHKDQGDHKFCVIVTFADGEGGGLGLVEPALVIRTAPRTMSITLIHSSKVTHFNEHFTGRRISLVFHSDLFAKRWVANRNGWAENMYIRTVRNTDIDL
jgi:hypothetical protein